MHCRWNHMGLDFARTNILGVGHNILVKTRIHAHLTPVTKIIFKFNSLI